MCHPQEVSKNRDVELWILNELQRHIELQNLHFSVAPGYTRMSGNSREGTNVLRHVKVFQHKHTFSLRQKQTTCDMHWVKRHKLLLKLLVSMLCFQVYVLVCVFGFYLKPKQASCPHLKDASAVQSKKCHNQLSTSVSLVSCSIFSKHSLIYKHTSFQSIQQIKSFIKYHFHLDVPTLVHFMIPVP